MFNKKISWMEINMCSKPSLMSWMLLLCHLSFPGRFPWNDFLLGVRRFQSWGRWDVVWRTGCRFEVMSFRVLWLTSTTAVTHQHKCMNKMKWTGGEVQSEVRRKCLWCVQWVFVSVVCLRSRCCPRCNLSQSSLINNASEPVSSSASSQGRQLRLILPFGLQRTETHTHKYSNTQTQTGTTEQSTASQLGDNRTVFSFRIQFQGFLVWSRHLERPRWSWILNSKCCFVLSALCYCWKTLTSALQHCWREKLGNYLRP